jgi:hypothetical protein
MHVFTNVVFKVMFCRDVTSNSLVGRNQRYGGSYLPLQRGKLTQQATLMFVLNVRECAVSHLGIL